MINVRVKKFLTSEQIQIYSKPFREKGSVTYEKNFVRSTGEIFPCKSKPFYNPFEECMGFCQEMGDEAENKKRSARRSKNMVYDIAKSNNWEWFVTLTFNPEKVDSFNYDEVSTRLSQWLKNMRKKCPKMKYLVVPEKHPTSGRFHFHGLFAHCNEIEFVDSGHKDKQGRCVYNMGKYKLGFTTAVKIDTGLDSAKKITSYIAKYISKELCDLTKGKKRYWYSRNCNRPVVEDMLVDDSKLCIEKAFTNGKHVKTLESPFGNVAYIDVECGESYDYVQRPIYTTNAHGFAQVE